MRDRFKKWHHYQQTPAGGRGCLLYCRPIQSVHVARPARLVAPSAAPCCRDCTRFWCSWRLSHLFVLRVHSVCATDIKRFVSVFLLLTHHGPLSTAQCPTIRYPYLRDQLLLLNNIRQTNNNVTCKCISELCGLVA